MSALAARLAMAWRERRLETCSWLLLLGTLAAAVLLRFIGLNHLPGINADEAVFPVHAQEWRAGVPLSELRTGTNLPMNPVFFGLVTLLSFLPVSFWTLRLSALLLSLLAVGLAYICFRGRSRSFAALFALLLAVLPIQLGYARLAWDPTAVPAVLVLALAAATRGWLLASVLAFLLGLWVHPSSVFAGPVLVCALGAARWPRDAAGRLRRPRPWALGLVAASVLVGVGAALWAYRHGALPVPVLAALRHGLLGRIQARALDLDGALSFARLYAEFVSGPTIYRYVVASMPSAAAALHVAAAALTFGALVVPALWRMPAATRVMDRAVALGLLLSLVGTYLVGGLEVLTPHTERYGMCLVAPTCYLLAASIDAIAQAPRSAAFARLAAAAAGLLWLASFSHYFLAGLQQPNPDRHVTFRTGKVDPKQGAFDAILARRAPGRTTVIRTEDWWLYWPLRYLAGAEHGLHVTIEGARWDYRFPGDFEEPLLEPEARQLFYVAWAGSDKDAEFAGGAEESIELTGYGQLPILRVYRLPLEAASAAAALSP